jgi:hypothetical protein
VKKQTSKEVELKHGAAYLLTALLKEHGGKDHLSVGIKYPTGDVEKPMSKKYLYLSKFACSSFIMFIYNYMLESVEQFFRTSMTLFSKRRIVPRICKC